MIILKEYNPDWPAEYERERPAVAEAIRPYVEGIEHVGSTSIPGIAAKPIVDIAVDLNIYPLPQETIAAMEALGYEHMGEYGIVGRHFFRKGTPRTHHVHAYSPGNPEWDSHILFRDYLRAHPEAAHRYEMLKRELATRYTDVTAYSEAKSDFVREILEKGRLWRSGQE